MAIFMATSKTYPSISDGPGSPRTLRGGIVDLGRQPDTVGVRVQMDVAKVVNSCELLKYTT